MAILHHHQHQDQPDHQHGGPQQRPKYLGESCRSPHTCGTQHADSYTRHEERSFMQPAIQTATAMPTMQTMPAMPPGPARGK